VGASASKCHECGASMTYSLAAASRSLSKLLPSESPVTYIVLAANFMLFTVTLAATAQTGEFSLLGGVRGDVLYRLGAMQPLRILQGEWFRLVMPIFLHGGLLHIAMNSMVLLDLGPSLEETYGSARYLFLYVITGVLGFVLSAAWGLVVWGGGGLSIGASGSLMGLIGVMLAITRKRGGAYMRMIRAQLIRSVVIIFAIGFFIGIVDNAAHLGGVASGFLLGQVMEDREPMNSRERNRAYALGWLAALIVLGSFAALLLRHFGPR
jgi:membrane associated rhomboid family serine protease